MEGLDFSELGQADAAEYISGRITLAEFGRRTRERYGVPEGNIRSGGWLPQNKGGAIASSSVTDKVEGGLGLREL